MKDELKLKKWSLSKFKKEYWEVFSKWVKLRDKRICFTCGKITEGRDSQAGHFIPAGACGLELYFSPDNVHCQCGYCNLTLQGNQYIYGQKLGKEKADELWRMYYKKKDLIYSKQDYLRLINEYKEKCQKIINQKKEQLIPF